MVSLLLNGTAVGKSQDLYTRNGAFRFDSSGYLVNPAGYRVQGYNTEGAGKISSVVEDIQIAPGRLLQPHATDEVIVNANMRPDDPHPCVRCE